MKNENERECVQQHLISRVSGVRRDKPFRCGCKKRETIRMTDKDASAPCLPSGIVTCASLFSVESATMKFRIVFNIEALTPFFVRLMATTYIFVP